jgi:DNA-binding beta-propeller fold protein YncE
LKQPHDIAVVSANEWYVADEFGPAVSHVLDGQVTQTFTGLLQPGGAAAVDRTAAVVDVRGRLLFLYRDGREIARLPAGAGPTHVVSVGHNMLVVADTTGAKLLIYDVSVKPRLISTLDTPPGPYGMAYDERRGDLYVTATGTNELIRYSVNDASNGGEGGAVLTESGRYPTVRNPYSVAVDDSGSVVVVGADPPILQLIQP